MLLPSTEGRPYSPLSLNTLSHTYTSHTHVHSPLLYGLQIVENFEVLREYAFESRDYQVTPGSPWNYALRLRNDTTPSQDMTYVSTGMEIGVPPFSTEGAPGKIVAQVLHTQCIFIARKVTSDYH